MSDLPKSEPLFSDVRAESAAVSDEPFACPHCGQMLGAACRICVACKQPVDAAAAKKAAAQPMFVRLPVPPIEPVVRARFSWMIFAVCLASIFVLFTVVALACLAARITTPDKLNPVVRIAGGWLALGSSIWVFYDARQKHIPKPLRWAVSTALVWIIAFPWYLSRRRTPRAVVPFMEAESSVFFRVLLIVVLALFVLNVAAVVTQLIHH